MGMTGLQSMEMEKVIDSTEGYAYRLRRFWVRVKQAKTAYLFLLPFTIVFFTFTILPVLASIV